VIFTTCMSEMNSVAYFIAALDSDDGSVLARRDAAAPRGRGPARELRLRLLEAWSPFLEQTPAARDGISSTCASPSRSSSARSPAASTPSSISRPTINALGVVHPALAAEAFRATMKDAVVPGLARFGLAAEGRLERRTLG